MSLLKTWKRRILRRFAKKNTDKGVLNRTWKKIATGIAGLGFLATNSLAIGQTSNIQAFDSNSTQVDVDYDNNNFKRFHITTTTTSGSNAFNSFSNFNLATNETANFYLPNGTGNLINFVKSKIEIDGTVNAIKNNKIGGNLFFLSSQGLVLGSSGVVNCGALYAMTPTAEFMDKFVGNDNGMLNINDNATEIAQITSRKFVNHNGVAANDGIPLNADGSIVIAGRINAIDNFSAHAGSVTLEGSGRIDTGITDFSALVNTDNIWKQDENGGFYGQPLLDVGVSGLAMTTNDDGNVELVAVADTKDKTSSTSIVGGTSVHVKATAAAKVSVSGTVNAKRNANFEAVAVNGTLTGTETIAKYGENRSVKSFSGAKFISSTNAQVEVNSTARINADKDVAMRALAINVYKNSTSPVDLGLMFIGMVAPVNIAAEVVVAESKAEVKVAQGALVTAKKNIDVKASSEADVIVGASTSLVSSRQTPGGGVAAGVVFAEVTSDANIAISGSLNAGTAGDTAAGDIALNAVSENSLDATAASKTAGDKSAISTGIVIGKVTNRSDIKINNTAVINAKKEVKGKALTRSDVSTEAIVETGDDTFAGMAINFTDFDSSAHVDVKSSVDAVSNIDLSAANLVLQNRSTAKGTVGHSKFSKAVANLQTSLIDGIFSLSKFTSKFAGPIKDQAAKFRAAGSVVINRGSHNAGLDIGSDVNLTSGNDLILKSSSVVRDLFIQADSVARSKANTADGAKASVSAGIVYADISQDSTVKIADASYDTAAGNKTVLTGKTVDIGSEAKVEYNRVKRMIAAIEDAIATLESITTTSTQKNMINSVKAAYSGLKGGFSALGAEGLSKAENITAFINALSSLVTMGDALGTLVAGESRIVAAAAKTVTSAADFAFYNNFLNTAVSSAVKGATAENTTDIGFAGAVGLMDFNLNSDVLVGRNVTVKSVNPGASVADSVKISAKADVDMISGAGYLIPSSGSKAMGGTYFSQDFNTSAKVMIPEGVNLNGGGKDISISAANDVKAIAGGFSAAMAGAGIQGMFTHLTGVNDASVNFDNEADAASVRNLKLNALNNTRIINFAGSVMISSSVGVAAGFAINDFVKDSIVLVGDIDTKYQDYLDKKAGTDKNTTTDSTRSRTDAKIAATGQVDAQAKSQGGFIVAGVAGGITKNDDSGDPGITSKITGKVDSAEKGITDTINKVAGKFSSITSELSSKTKTASSGTHTNPSISLSVAGSGGLNFIETNTRVDVSGMTLELGGTTGSNLNAIAVNNTDVMAFAGTAGIMFQTATKDTSGKSVGIAGAVGMNNLKNKTEAVIKNSTVNNADNLNVFAVNGGMNIAAGLGLQVSKNSGNAAGAFTMGGSVSLNNIDNTVNAELNNTNVTGKSALKTDVNVAAYESDLQITGGVQVTVGQQRGAFGAAVNVSKIDNNVSAKITGGTFNQVNNISVSALQAIAQINGAVTAGVIFGTSNTTSIMGALIYNDTDNNLTAKIDGATINAAGNVAVNAQDYLIGESTTGFGQILNRADSGVSSFVSADGGDYYDVNASNEVDGTLATPLKDQIKKGSLIVSGAMAISVADTAVGAAVSINDIDSNFTARIENSTINTIAGTVETNARTDTFMISAAGGVAASTKSGAGGGSVVWNDIDSEINSGTVNSVITAGNYLSKAANDSRLIGIAGQVTAGKGAAVGLAFTYNKLTSKSNAFSLGSKITGPAYAAGSQFLVNAANNGEILNLALTVPVSDIAGIGGAVAINRIDDNAVAIVDNVYVDAAGVTKTVAGSNASGFENVSTIAEEKSSIKAISGSFAFGGQAAVGGAVSYNEITGKTGADMNNIALGGKNVLIKAVNDADIWTMGAGCGGSGEVSVQGAAATGEITRTVAAGMSNVSENKTDSLVDVLAESTGEINSNATVVSIGAGVAGVGAGVVVNRMNDTVSSSVNGGALTVKDLEVRAKASQTIRAFGAAGAGGAYAGVSGSVAVNIINNAVNAMIKGNASVVAADNIGVVAQSDETLLNYAGIVSGGLVGVGAGLSVNDIQGSTNARIENSTVQAAGAAGGVSLNNGISDTAMNDAFIDDSTLNVQYTLEKKRTSSTKRGLVVDSSATHTLKSFVANAAAGGGGIAGTVNLSRISGTTGAGISNTRINNGANSDVSVNAGDYSNLSGFVGSVGLGAAGVGIAADTGIVSRTTSAKLDGIISDTTSSSVARDVSVKADAKLGISALDAGLAVGAGANAIAGTLSTNVMQSNTEAIVNDANITLRSLAVNAAHLARTSIAAGSAAISFAQSLGGSLGVNTVKDIVKAEVTGSSITMQSNGSGKFEVQALNDTTLQTVGAAAGGSLMVTGTGNLAVNLIESDVLAHVKNTTMTNRATDVTVKADDKLTVNANLGTVAVGAVGAGASVAVNSLDGRSRVVIDSSVLYARDNMNITADTTRNLELLAATVAGGAGAFTGNVVYISAGKLLTTGSEDGASNVRDTVTAAENNSFANIGATNGALTDAEKTSLNAKPGKLSSSAAAKSETSVKVVKNGASFPRLDCRPAAGTGVVNIKAKETTNIGVTGGGAAVGALSAGGSVCFIDLQRNVAADVRSAYLYSGTTGLLEALSTGKTNLKMYQGTLGIVGAATAAYGRISTSGTVNANLSSGVQRCDGNLTVNATDDAEAKAESYGLTVGGKYAAGVLVTQIDNNSAANVTLTNNNHSSRNFTAKAEKSNKLTAQTLGGAVGIFAAGSGIVSTVNDGGSATLAASGGTYSSTSGKIDLSAVSRPQVVSEAKSAAISGLVSAGASVAKATLSGTTEVKVINAPTFNSPEIAFTADNQGTSNLLAEGLSGGFAASFGYNETNAQNNSIVNVLIGDAVYSNINTILSLKGLNNVDQKVETRGLNVGGLVASGNNKAKAEAGSSTNVSLGGSTTEKTIRRIAINAQNTSTHDIKADGNGGGLISVDGLAAYAINTITGTVNAAISGKWKLQETLSLLASQSDRVKIVADSLQAALIGYSGTKAENTITATTNASFGDDSSVTAAGGDITFTALNAITCNQNGEKSASGAGYGGIVVNGAWGITNITSNTEAKVGKGVNLLSNIGEIKGEALTRAHINNKVLTQGAGVVANPLAFSQNTISLNDRVLTDTTSLLKTAKPGKNISLAASDNLTAVLTADADMQGGFGGVSKAEAKSTVSKNNSVDIYGDISSTNDVNIYTDADAAGQKANYDLTATADSYNKSTAAVAKAALDSGTTQNNKINIYSGADIESIRHINLNSGTGNILLLEAASEYTWHSGDSTGGYSSTASGERINSLSGEKKVTIGGNLLAGKENKVELTIGGTVDVYGEISNSVTTPTITSSKPEYAAGVTTGVMDYANELFERYLKICDLILEYTGTPAADGYTAEKTRLLDEMKKYGLYDPDTGLLLGGLLVQYISLPDMLCTGGDVVINSDSVSGNGNITAKGAPQILVNNNSNLYMKAGDMTIVEGGGRLIYNSASLGSTAKSKLTSLSSITLNEADALISLKENWNGTLNATIDGEVTSVTPITNIELNGNISNPYGKVQISNSSGDIVMQGRTVQTGATINALAVELLAPKGAITQGFTEGIVNIGGNPEDIYKAFTDSYAATISTNQSTTTNQTVTKFPKFPATLDTRQQNGTWIAGGAVYLNASDINVNGLIQSGYADYKLTLTSGTAINSLISDYDSAYQGQEITPDMLTAYKLNTAGVKKDTGGNWYYEVQAYYNPQTKSVVIEDISPQGGKIYLTGRISSTGNGKIRAFDGSANINLNVDLGKTNNKLPVTLGRVNLGDEAGLVSITDTAKKVRSEFTRNATTFTEYDRYKMTKHASHSSTKGYSVWWERTNLPDLVTVTDPAATYQPTTGFYYNWTTGQTISGTNMWYKEVKFKVWGAYTKTKSQLQLEEQKTENLLPGSGTINRPRLPGIFIGGVSGSSDPYFIKYTKNVSSYSEFYQEWKTFDNAIHSKGTEHYKWGNTQDSSVTYQHAFKADNPISISFIGSTTGGSLNLTSGGNVNLSGSVTGKAGSALTFTSNKGTIQQTGGQLVSDNFNFSATNGIGSNGAINCKVVSDTGYLNAVSTAGNINVAAVNSSGKYGDIKVKKVTTSGNVMLDVYGSIYRNSSNSADSLVQGQRIDLTSRNGQIGKAGGGWLFIQAGQTPVGRNDTMSASVNATAKTNICLEQVSGDMRLGRIESKGGSVDLKVTNGSFDNALPVNTESGKRSTDALVDKWLELGLIKGDGKNTGAAVRQTAVDNYKNSVKTEYASYQTQKTWYAANPKATKTAEYNTMHTRYGSYTSADAYLKAMEKNTGSDYYKLLYGGTYGWTQDQLLYALQSSIMNRTTGSTGSYNRDANITGKNITLSAANGGIGKDAAAETVSLTNLGSNLDTLKKLAAAEADDITWDEVNAKATINRTTAIGIKMTSSSNYLNATARDNIYLAAATEDPIYVKTIDSGSSNIRLLGRNGIFNYNTDASVINLKGKDLLIEGGAVATTGSIGTADKAIVTDLSGKLTARAEGLINICQYSSNPLLISALYGGADVKLRALKDLKSVNTGVAFDDSGYLNAMGKLTLASDYGNIGEDGKGVRVLTDNMNSLEITASGNLGGNVYIKAVTNSSTKPTMNLGAVTNTLTGAFKVDNSGAAVNFTSVVNAGAVDITASTITQNTAGVITATGFKGTTTAGLSLNNVNNKISRFDVANVTGNILLKNAAALTLGDISFSTANAANTLTVSNNGALTLAGTVDVENIDLTAKSATQEAASIIDTSMLKMLTSGGSNLSSVNNMIRKAELTNTKSGNIAITSKSGVNLQQVSNTATSGSAQFAVTSAGTVDFDKDVTAKEVLIDANMITQNANSSKIVANAITARSAGGLSLDSLNNEIGAANLYGAGNITLYNKGSLNIGALQNSSTRPTHRIKVINNGSLAVKGTVSGKNVELAATSMTQAANTNIVADNLTAVTDDGLSLNSGLNEITKATLTNKKSGNITISGKTSLELAAVTGAPAVSGNSLTVMGGSEVIFGGSVNAANVNVTAASISQNETSGSIVATKLEATADNGISLDSTNNQISSARLVNKQSGSILLKNKTALALAGIDNIGRNAGIVNIGTLALGGNINARVVSLDCTSLTQDGSKGKILTGELTVNSVNGMSLTATANAIERARLTNSTKGNIELYNSSRLELMAENRSTSTGDKLIVNCSGDLRAMGTLVAPNIDLTALAFMAPDRVTTDNLKVITTNGMFLENLQNQIKNASLKNTVSGDVIFRCSGNLNLLGLDNGSTGKAIILADNGNIDFAGGVTSKKLEVTGTIISQNEVTSTITTDNLKVTAKDGLSLDSSTNAIAAMEFNNGAGDVIIKNAKALSLKGKTGGSLMIGNNGSITAAGNISGSSVRIDLAGDMNSNYSLSADNNLVVNATGKITLLSARGKSVTLNTGAKKSTLSLNTLNMADMNLRLQIDEGEAAENTGGTVNQIGAAGGISVHDLLAEEDVYGSTEGGDIMLANIDGKRVTLIINHNEGKVNVEQAQLGESMNVTAGGFKGGQLEHTGTDNSLELSFNGVNGRYMNDVTIDKVASGKGVHVSNLDSVTARIDADTDVFQLSSVDLLGTGAFSNGKTSVVIPGSENTSLEIMLAGAHSGVTRRAKQRSEQSLTDRIAGIVNNVSEGMKSSARVPELPGYTGQESAVEYSDSPDSSAVSMLVAQDGKIYLTGDNENDSGLAAENDGENPETEPNK